MRREPPNHCISTDPLRNIHVSRRLTCLYIAQSAHAHHDVRSVAGYGDLVSLILADLSVEGDADRIASWIELVASWNRRIDLTAARDDRELVDLMVADAAVLSRHVAGSLVDVGSGAGAPGLPLAILRPELAVSLVEPMQKRATLLRMAIGRLGLAPRVGVQQVRGEDVVQRYDEAVSRATLAPDAWLRLGASLADVVWVLLAQREVPTLEGWEVVETHGYRWPLTGAQRRAVKLAKSR